MDRSFKLVPEQASTMAGKVDALALFLLAITVFFTVLILVLVAYLSLRYRRRSDDFTSPNPPATHTSTLLEVAWTAIPLGIVMVVFVWSAKLFVEQYQAPKGAMEVHVIGKQWMWKVQHPEGNREINELHVPVGRTVRLTLASQDVIHSFFLPAFRIKQDVVPGHYFRQWFTPTKPGIYHLFCAEYCGTAHSRMIGRVVVMEPGDFENWLAAGKPSESLAQSGERLFRELGCSGCHMGNAQVRAPRLEGLYGRAVPLANQQVVRADEGYIRDSILLPQAQIAAGYEPLMPTFAGRVSEEELLELVAYIKSLGSKPPERSP
jgi:cytochrome c oxidase subunit II